MKKIASLLLAIISIFSLVLTTACEKNEGSTSSSQNSSSSSIEETSSSNEETSSSEEEQSSSVHVCVFDQKIDDIAYLAEVATAETPAKLFFVCECGEVGTETYDHKDALGYDYSQVEDYLNKVVTATSNRFWNSEGKEGWNYMDGCMMTALLSMYEVTGEEKYLTQAKKFVDECINDKGDSVSIDGYRASDYNSDSICEGRVLFDLYDLEEDEDKKNVYKMCIELIATQFEGHPRTNAGCMFHKKSYSYQVWLDGIFMSQVFSIRNSVFTNTDYDDVLTHVRFVETTMKDSVTGLYYHGHDEKKVQNWANKTTGLSQSFWGRSIGWYMGALADIYHYMPQSDTETRAEIAGYIKHAVDSLLNFVDEESNMFYQVVDKGATGKNYLETSGTALIAYAILRAVNDGALDESYALEGKKLFNGICKTYLEGSGDTVNLGGICQVAGLSWDRDGSFKYYTEKTAIVSNEAKGSAPFLMAYAELNKLYYM